MNPSVQDLEESWRRATDADVRRALLDLDGYPSEVIHVIHGEAMRRSIDPVQTSQQTAKQSLISRSFGAGVAYVYSRPLRTSVVLGVAITVFQMKYVLHLVNLPRMLPSIIYFMLILLGNAGISWPLRDYKNLCRNALALSVPGIIWGTYRSFGWFPRQRWTLQMFSYAVTGIILFYWVFPIGLLAMVVWVRRQYKPIYPSGHCQRCGYDLTGLPLPRCPECGLGFVT